ncbi:MAG: ATP-binding protein [Candidatus Jordarchaeaceae archaeon]
MIEIVIVSGKGGTGKTTVAASLALLASKNGFKVVAADTDVDAPNLALLINGERAGYKIVQVSEKAFIDKGKCSDCGKCMEVCKFDAIRNDGEKYIVNSLYCEGCGLCKIVCPVDAIEIRPVDNGEIITIQTDYGFPLVMGHLKIGESGSGKVVSEVKEEARNLAKIVNPDFLIVDGPPGSGCAAIASISGANFVVTVTEPTMAAKHDVGRIISIINHFGIPFGMIINKYDIFPEMTSELSNYVEEAGGVLLGKIPVDENVVRAIVNKKAIVDYAPSSSASRALTRIFSKLMEILNSGG